MRSANVGDQFGDPTSICFKNVWLVLFLDQRQARLFLDPLSMASANPKYGPGWAFGIPGIAMVIATCFLGGRKKNGPCRPAGLGYLKETFSKDGLITLGSDSDGLCFYFGLWALWE